MAPVRLLACSLATLVCCGTGAGGVGSSAGGAPSDTPSQPTTSPASPASPAEYDIVELPAVEGYAGLTPGDLNERGDVVGTYLAPPPNPPGCVACGTYTFPAHTFLYDAASGTARRIGDDGVSASQVAAGINDSRQVALYTCEAWDCVGRFRSFRWENDALIPVGSLTDASAGSAAGLRARDIDAAGRILGWSFDSDGVGHTVLWDGTSLHDFGGQPESPYAPAPRAFDSAGRIVGTVAEHLVLIEPDGVRVLAPVGSTFAGPRDVSERGRVVGSTRAGGDFGAPSAERAFVFDLPNGPMREPIEAPSRLLGVNVRGDAVGVLLNALPYGAARAFLWREEEVIDLTDAVADPAWELTSATAINDRGQIVGTGLHHGEWRGFILTPR
jgi:uncharacterized membrane protein